MSNVHPNENNIQLVEKHACQVAKELVEHEPVILDTETTGLDENARIVDICILDLTGKELFESLVNPGIPIPAEASAIHGITDKMIATSPSWPDVFPTIAELTSAVTTLSYNAEFDARMIRQMNDFYKQGFSVEPKWSCIMELYAEYVGEWDDHYNHFRWQKLASAQKQLNLNADTRGAHRSHFDAEIARQILLVLAARADLPQYERALNILVTRLADARDELTRSEIKLAGRLEQLKETLEYIAVHQQEEIVSNLNSDVADLYRKLCSTQVDYFNDLRMNFIIKPVGTSVKQELVYDINEALSWCKENLQDALKPETILLDRVFFEKHARAVVKTQPLPFVQFVPKVTASVASDLSAYRSPIKTDPTELPYHENDFRQAELNHQQINYDVQQTDLNNPPFEKDDSSLVVFA